MTSLNPEPQPFEPEPAALQPPSPELQLKAGLDAERRGQTRGLLLLALVALLASLWRAGFGRVFTPGWWRLW